MEDRIRQVISAVFGVPVAQIDDQASMETIKGWDSHGHMKLVIALEQEFDQQFDDQKIPDLLSYKAILGALSSGKQ